MQRYARQLLSALVVCTAALIASPASAVIFGTNIHSKTDPAIAALLKQYNLKTVRMDLNLNSNFPAYRDHALRLRANGAKVEVSLQVSYQWNYACPQDLPAVEKQAYDETVVIVEKTKDVIFDYELLNEISLRQDTRVEVPWNSAGSATAPYENKPCYKTMAAVLRGMSRAIHDIRDRSGYPLRVILGALGRDFGLLTFMEQQGVAFDVVGYHIYPHATQRSLLDDPWFGAGGPLKQLAAFKRPVHLNEFNCGEIYDADYDNQPNSAKTRQCFETYKKHLKELVQQNIIELESIHVYELFDEPQKAAPENHFGLMYDLQRPKVHILIIAAFAGGTLSASEEQAVIQSGILSAADIAAYKKAAGPPTPTLQSPARLRLLP